jgi:hypothetical protein
MRLAPLIVAVSLLIACSPAQAPATATATATAPPASPHVDATTAAIDVPAEFQAASGNLGCDYVPAGGTDTYTTPDGGPQLICDRIAPAYVRFTLSAHGPATLINHVGDASCCAGDMLAPGAHWTGGPFACELTQAGMTCLNADRRGFTLSRADARPN